MTRIHNICIAILLVVITRGEISIDLGKEHMPNLLLVRVHGGINHTNGECSTIKVSDMFPQSTISLLSNGNFSGDTESVVEPVLIAFYNPYLQQICEKQRRKLLVDNSEEPTIRLLSICYNCPSSDRGESIRFLTGSDEQSLMSYATIARLVSENDSNQIWAHVLVHSIRSQHDKIDHRNLEIRIRILSEELVVSAHADQMETVSLDRMTKRRRLGGKQKRTTSKLPMFRSSRIEDTTTHESHSSSIGVVELTTVSESLVLPAASNTRSGTKTEECTAIVNECCDDNDCLGENNVCVYQTCIDDGFPRFTLAWEGDDDIDLYVITPGGFVLSYTDKYDEATQGRVGEPVVQNAVGKHVENVYFPLDGSAPSGTYEFYVRPMTTVAMEDQWTLVVSDEQGEVMRQTGTRFSSIFTYMRRASTTLNQLSIPTTSPGFALLPARTLSPSIDPLTSDGDGPLLTPSVSPTSESSLSHMPILDSVGLSSSPTSQPQQDSTATSVADHSQETWNTPVEEPFAPSFAPSCDLLLDECCSDSDCLFAGEVCVNRNCVDNGNPRITLSWIGDDDLDLFVLTPAGKELSFMNFFDPISGGRFGEEVDQFGTGYHVENVYFPEAGAPYGNYEFFVRPLTTVNARDIWTITVIDHGKTMISETGTGVSSRFSYFRDRPAPTPSPNPSPVVSPSPPGPATLMPTNSYETPAPSVDDQNSTSFPVDIPSRPPQTIPGGTPTRPPQSDTECNSFFDECCENSDCRTSRDICEQRTCIRDGNPRFSLIWDGDDDLDLFVFTPDGIEISADRTFDIFSGGRFEMSSNQDQSGNHVENVYFPILGSPIGEFRYGVRMKDGVGNADSWILEVYEDGGVVASQTGEGESDEFPYVRDKTVEGPQRPTPSPPRCSPISDECCLDSDCEGSSICVQRTCIEEGSPRITLRWTGDDDLNLVVEGPNGVVLSPSNQMDPLTGGQHEADSNQSKFGFHVESVFFPADSAERGSYKYRVESATTQGVGADLWKVSVYEEGEVDQEYSGIGASREFIYERMDGAQPPDSPSPISPPVEIEPCAPSDDMCCEDSDCSSGEVCANRHCIGSGSPRITLTWTGDDDFDLYVQTPQGNMIFYNNRFDSTTQGVFDQQAIQGGYGNHVENVYFPGDTSPLGNYSASVRLASRRDTPDVWTLRIFDGGRQQLSHTGTGNSDFYTYKRQAAVNPTSPSAPATPPPIGPVTERPPPGQSPTQGDRICPHECCSDQDCDIPDELCVQRTCIKDGTPRFTLTWTGNDDLSLVVITPGGETISYLNPSDPESGGVFGEDASQEEFGFHVENIFFPSRGGPEGEYSYVVKSATISADPDRWAIRVFVDGQLVAWRTGTGGSRTFTYEYNAIAIFPTEAPVTSAPFTLPPAGTRPPVPPPTTDTCQMDTDCEGLSEVCVQETCINDGNPRFTLDWSGNDDLDLLVETPEGVVISKANPFDATSGGVFSEPGDQNEFGRHVENIYFPLGDSGIYKYYVKNRSPRGSNDSWRATVSVDGVSQVVQSSAGDSEKFEFDFNADGLEPIAPTFAPISPECSKSDECSIGKVCVKQSCVEDGNPRITLSWTGDDDLDLYVVTPSGVSISMENKVDALSSGRFGESDGVQTAFGKHIENIYFPETGPSGVYTVFLKSFLQRGSADLWSLDAVANGQAVVTEFGNGESEIFSFTFNGPPGSSPTDGPPVSLPTVSPTTIDTTCDVTSSECCSDMDCLGNERCIQRTCIDEGNPRFTLTWTGDDDLDLVVMTPIGTYVSFLNAFDESSGGRFGGTGDQFDFGRHVENVFFPLQGSPTGNYSYYVRSFLPTNEDDVWTIQVVVNGQAIESKTGTGNSGTLVFDYSESSTTTPIEAPSPSSLLPAPQSQPTVAPECNVQEEECCTDSQCITAVEICVQTQCIELGNPRFTLTWTGDDDLDLKVETPLGTIISFVEPLDQASGGVYGEEGSQFIFGKHVENIYFREGVSEGAPSGIYKYSVDNFLQRSGNDRWTVAVFVDNNEVATQTGFGDSVEFTYDFQGADTTENDDTVDSSPRCALNDNECCKDSDCKVDQELCIQRTCVDRGNPRFTLSWTGDDDLDLTVVTPFGTTLAVASPSDPLSGGIFGEDGDQLAFGQHVENIFFPLSGGPAGTYTFVVASFDEIGTPDAWTVTVYVDDAPVLTKMGTRTSDFFVFEYEDGFTLDAVGAITPRSRNKDTSEQSSSTPQLLIDCDLGKDECCSDSDCTVPMSLCVQRICIDEGNPRFTLTWNGNDDYDLLVTPPIGHVISIASPVDFESGGRFGENGIQSFPGLHAENIFFPLEGGPLGIYIFEIKAFQIIDFHDTWTVRVYVDGREVNAFSGMGDSGSFSYEYSEGGILQDLHRSKDDTLQTSSCSLSAGECCVDMDCNGEDDKCIQRTCIPIRANDATIVLTWIGDDDLDLTVMTPSGEEVSYFTQLDHISGAYFEQSTFVSSVNDLQFFPHSERVIIPVSSQDEKAGYLSTAGTFRYKVTTFNVVGSADPWTVQVFVEGNEVSNAAGSGDSEVFTFDVSATQPFMTESGPTPRSSETFMTTAMSTADIVVEPSSSLLNHSFIQSSTNNVEVCSGPSNCSLGNATCISRRCLEGGALQFTLSWDQEEDLILSVWTPDMLFYQPSEADATSGVLYPHWTFVDESTLHMQSLIFPISAPEGKYKFTITRAGREGTAGDWSIWIHQDGNVVFHVDRGSSASSFFGFEYKS